MEGVPEPPTPPIMPFSSQTLLGVHNVSSRFAGGWLEVSCNLGKLPPGRKVMKLCHRFTVPRTFMNKHYPALTSGSTLRLQVKIPHQNVMEPAKRLSNPSATVLFSGSSANTQLPALMVVSCVEAEYKAAASQGARIQGLGGCLKSYVDWHAVCMEKVRGRAWSEHQARTLNNIWHFPG